MQQPTEQDWEHDHFDSNLDVEYAYKHFAGKTLEQAEELFAANALCYQEDLMWMPPTPFRYYICSYINYLLGNKSENDTDAASCFIALVKHKLKCERENILAVWNQVEETLKYICLHAQWFNWNESIYGNLEMEIAATFQALNTQPKH
ncbi:MAG: hypothetical protein LBT46_02965 [Planctomycetaceae bacterium]|jgi:hypothetical protein|nr:hypothetical protein [Planctomycetaceae bacterium]